MRDLWRFCLAFCLILCFWTVWNVSADGALLEVDTMEIIGQRATDSGGAALDVSLTGRQIWGNVFAVLYRESGQMLALEMYPAAESVSVSFADTRGAAYGKVMWLDEHFMPMVPAETFRLDGASVEETDSFETFSGAVMDVMREFDSMVAEEDAERDPYAYARLIVHSTDSLPDLSAYHAARIIQDPDGYSIIQFHEAEDAETCANYLKTLPATDFVEPDSLVYADFSTEVETGAHSWGVAAAHADAYAANLAARGIATNIIAAVVYIR